MRCKLKVRQAEPSLSNLPESRLIFSAGAEGIEPSVSDLESDGLPLTDAPKLYDFKQIR